MAKYVKKKINYEWEFKRRIVYSRKCDDLGGDRSTLRRNSGVPTLIGTGHGFKLRCD